MNFLCSEIPKFFPQSITSTERICNTASAPSMTQLDLAAFEERANEPLIAFEDVVKELKEHGRI